MSIFLHSLMLGLCDLPENEFLSNLNVSKKLNMQNECLLNYFIDINFQNRKK